jgi:dephospho-CoA kinase
MDRNLKLDKTGIGVVGLPGAGKSLITEIAKELGIPTVIMGDIVREICLERGLEMSPENIGLCMVDIRKEEGMDAVAKRTLSKINQLGGEFVLIDGLRSYEEVDLYKKSMQKFVILAIHASPSTRYKRLKSRQRTDDSQDLAILKERDEREIQSGIAKIIALADIMFVNEEDIAALTEEIKGVLRTILYGDLR